MLKSPLLVSLLASGALAAGIAATPATAQTAQDPNLLAPIGGIVEAPVLAAGQIAATPFEAAGFGTPGMQSNRTAAFAAQAVPNVNFLNDASRMALSQSGSPAIRRFAHRVAKEQTIAGNSMTAWANTNPPTLTGRSSYSGDPLSGLVSMPLNVVVGTGNALTGGQIVPSADGHALMSSQAADLQRLSQLKGPQFDALYRSTQLDSLRQLATLYSDYAVNGDDPGLRSLARSELPKVKKRIWEISRI